MHIFNYRNILCLLLILICFSVEAQDLLINEVLASNRSITDEDGDYSDWLEIFNASDDPISLSDYRINDANSFDNAWQLPDIILSPSNYVLVWASSKNRKDVSYHTDFKLSEGESVYLFDLNEELLDSLFIESVCADISIGRFGSEIVYFEETTPGAQNSDVSFSGILENTIRFSNSGGNVGPLVLELEGNENGETIRYTTDASIPTSSSLEYTGAIPINTNTVIRACLFKENFLPSKASSRSYLVDVEHALPVVALVTEPNNFFDEDVGIYAFGSDYVNQFPYFGANFWQDWERPLHFSLYEADSLAFELNAGTKIFGGWSRANDQRSLSIFARGGYGTSEIKYKLFPELDYDIFQALVLRNSGNDFLESNMRDITLTSLMSGSGLEFSAFKPVATYLNGEYWGMYNLREKINEHFLASKYGVDPSQIDLLEFAGSPVMGDSTEYLELITFLENNNLANDANFAVLENEIDIENFIIYQVTQIYFDNTDWPGNNIKFWRTPETKWRWILYDIDFGFGIWTPFSYFNNTLGFALEENGPVWPNPPWSTLLFRKSVENIGFRNRFINRFADELNSRFLPQRVDQHITNTQAMIASEIERHYTRWNGSLGEWESELGDMRLFAINRPDRVKGHILSEFNLPDYHTLTLEIEDSNQGYVYINNRLKIDESTWSGDYFESVPIELIAIAHPGYVFSHWEEDLNSTESKLLLDVNSNTTLRPVFEVAIPNGPGVIINEINYNAAEDFDTKDWVEIHNRSDNYVDLSSWVLKDSDDTHSYVFADGMLLEGKGFFVISRDLADFKALHPGVENAKGGLGFGLSSEQDELRLFNSFNDLIDSVSYSSIEPWTELANGQGYTLELIRPDLDNLVPENWAAIHQNGSPGITNEDVSSSTENIPGLEISCFPNPVPGQLKVILNLDSTKALRVHLLNEHGGLVRVLHAGTLNKGNSIHNYDLENYPEGIYYIQITDSQGYSNTRKVIKL